jgi:hypothetical protein
MNVFVSSNMIIVNVCHFLVVVYFYPFVFLDQNVQNDLKTVDSYVALDLLYRKIVKNEI